MYIDIDDTDLDIDVDIDTDNWEVPAWWADNSPDSVSHVLRPVLPNHTLTVPSLSIPTEAPDYIIAAQF